MLPDALDTISATAALALPPDTDDISFRVGTDVDRGRRGGGGGINNDESLRLGAPPGRSTNDTGAEPGPCSKILLTYRATIEHTRQLGGSTGLQDNDEGSKAAACLLAMDNLASRHCR